MMISGSIPALVTPFTADEDAWREHVEPQIAGGCSGMVACGATGEAATLSAAEHFRVVEVCVQQTGERVPVIAGAGSNDTRVAIANVRAAARAGADAVPVAAP